MPVLTILDNSLENTHLRTSTRLMRNLAITVGTVGALRDKICEKIIYFDELPDQDRRVQSFANCEKKLSNLALPTDVIYIRRHTYLKPLSSSTR